MTRKLLLLIGVLAAFTLLIAGPAMAVRAPKVDVCHRTGNGSYHLISVSRNALPAHLRHGDAQPGDEVPNRDGFVFDEDCLIVEEPEVELLRVQSPLMVFGPLGWGGWSCPAGYTVVDGGYEPENLTVVFSGPAKPGEVMYPVYPHHTFVAGETGWVVQNINVQQTLSVYALCEPN